jgi:hypothetical protein
MAFNLNGFNFNQSVVDSQGRVINTRRSHHTAEREREETETETELELETLNINGGRISTSFLHALSCN